MSIVSWQTLASEICERLVPIYDLLQDLGWCCLVREVMEYYNITVPDEQRYEQ
jgi:hypothetical protein